MTTLRKFPACFLILACLYGQSAFADEEALDAYYTGDYQTAINIWEPEAKAGDMEAQFYLGAMYSAGQGIEKNLPDAAAWFEKAAVQGHMEAQYNLGVAYKDGLGVEKNDAKAVAWWKKAAGAGYARAQYNLASMYFYGQGVEKDMDMARSWYSKAAEQGDKAAISILGKLAQQESERPRTTEAKNAGRKKAVISLSEGPAPASDPAGSSPTAANEIIGGDIQSEAWVLDQDSGNYTVQLYASTSKADILEFISSHPVPDAIAYYRFQSNKGVIYRLVTGSYISYLDAGEAVRRMSPQVKQWAPWIRKLEGVQTEIRLTRQEQSSEPQVKTADKDDNVSVTPRETVVEPEKSPQAVDSVAPIETHSERFTIQVFSAESEQKIRKFLSSAGLTDDVTIYRIMRDGLPWYRANYGEFGDIQQAKIAAKHLPPAIQATKPWVRKLSSVKQEQVVIAKKSHTSDKEVVGSPPVAPAETVTAPQPAKLSSRTDRPQSDKPSSAETASAKAPAKPVSSPSQVSPARTPVASSKVSPAQVKKILRAGQTSFMVGDYVSAFRLWRPLAEDGVKEAQYNLGFMHESGWGVTQNFAEAVSWYRSAAEQGEFRAQFNLGLLYLSGHGVDKNIEQGIYWVERAAAKGHLRAQEFLANAYETGEYGLDIDPKKSRFWAQKAGLD